MNNKIIIILVIAAISIILSHMIFGHLIGMSTKELDTSKYSAYVHLQPEWKSHPANIIFDITIMWDNPNDEKKIVDGFNRASQETEYNTNEISYISGKPYVELKHEFSNCENNWIPIAYRDAIDTVRHEIEYLTGEQLTSDPNVKIFPTIENSNYSAEEQKQRIENGYSQFIPICTSKDVTSYDYNVRINNEKIGFDVYFIPSITEREKYHQNLNEFGYYKNNSCYAINYQSFSGTCENVSNTSGLLIVIPDEIDTSVLKVDVNFREL